MNVADIAYYTMDVLVSDPDTIKTVVEHTFQC
jgi:hypothetical protein